MTLVRLSQTQRGTDDPELFDVRIEHDGASVQVEVRLGLTARDREDIRWYLEDYAANPTPPAPAVAARVEARLAELGETLFRATFQGNQDAADLWARLRDHLPHIRVEIATGVAGATALPWELLRDPRTGRPLALDAGEFVRVPVQAGRRAPRPEPKEGEPIRILLVICRPGQGADVPYRSVAGRLVKGLTEQGRERVRLEVLRPATFARLAEVLRAAKEGGEPYHVVHFDGHGTYGDLEADEAADRPAADFDARLYEGAKGGAHGYLVFEHPEQGDRMQLVRGRDLGGLLYETQVPVLVLNACRSAFAEPPADNRPDGQVPRDHQAMIEAYGTLAQEIMDQGVAGVVAWRYSVYVVTAARFMADLYAVLAEGHSLGRAVTRGRKALAADPTRVVDVDPVELRDWPVPVVYEARPLTLFPPKAKPAAGGMFTIDLGRVGTAGDEGGLPAPPDLGFFGRDEILLALDRAFDRHGVALLHAYAGSGKTTTAAEFARWYRDTGGLGEGGPVLFAGFQHHHPLARLLDGFGQAFGPLLEGNNIPWQALNHGQRRALALDVLRQVPVLWIWDNVEPVAGFPAGTPSLWSAEEQRELADFLRDLSRTKAKVLLTSRRDERGWLGDLPTRIAMGGLRPWESRAMAEEILHRHRRDPRTVRRLQPLLDFAAGNPMAVGILVNQALRDGRDTGAAIEDFVAALRAGAAEFDDDQGEERSQSLGASLAYGLEHAFSPEDQRRLALLHLFQGVVQAQVLAAVAQVSGEQAGTLLSRAAEIGMLQQIGTGFYTIHPALPWFLRSRFEQAFPAGEPWADSPAGRAARAYAGAVAVWGNQAQRHFIAGHHEVVGMLAAEEHNLLHARRLGLAHSWPDETIMAMQGLRNLYATGGRWSAWSRLVAELVPLVADGTDRPHPGREEHWGAVMDYRAELAAKAHDETEVLRLLRLRVAVDVRRAEALLARDPASLDRAERNILRSLAVSRQRLGSALTQGGDAAAMPELQAARDLCRRIGDRGGEEIAVFNLGHAYLEIPALRDLDKAASCYRASLELCEEHDAVGRAGSLGQLGRVAQERFEEEMARPDADRELALRYLNEAAVSYHQVLDLLPTAALAERATCHHLLAVVCGRAGMVTEVIKHGTEAIRLHEGHDPFRAAHSRFNLAADMLDFGRLSDALAYAHAARDGYVGFGPAGAEGVARCDRLIARIEEARAEGGG